MPSMVLGKWQLLFKIKLFNNKDVFLGEREKGQIMSAIMAGSVLCLLPVTKSNQLPTKGHPPRPEICSCSQTWGSCLCTHPVADTGSNSLQRRYRISALEGRVIREVELQWDNMITMGKYNSNSTELLRQHPQRLDKLIHYYLNVNVSKNCVLKINMNADLGNKHRYQRQAHRQILYIDINDLYVYMYICKYFMIDSLTSCLSIFNSLFISFPLLNLSLY